MAEYSPRNIVSLFDLQWVQRQWTPIRWLHTLYELCSLKGALPAPVGKNTCASSYPGTLQRPWGIKKTLRHWGIKKTLWHQKDPVASKRPCGIKKTQGYQKTLGPWVSNDPGALGIKRPWGLGYQKTLGPWVSKDPPKKTMGGMPTKGSGPSKINLTTIWQDHFCLGFRVEDLLIQILYPLSVCPMTRSGFDTHTHRISTPRRFGKTISVCLFVAALICACPNIEISIYSTCKFHSPMTR